eukprot:m51a1_g1851 putative solute carrier family 35 member f6 (369) ;mRNA; f:596757-598376
MTGLTLSSGLMELGMLATGTVITVMTKAAFSTSSRGWGGAVHAYEHPWTHCLFMFWAEALCMVVFLVSKAVEGRGVGGKDISSIALLYVSASVWQMLRGSVIVFSCVLSVTQSSWKTLVGIALVLVAMLISGTQMVVEEVLVKRRGYAPLQVVGMEGLLGSLVMSLVVLPVFYVIPGSQPSSMVRGSYENAVDAFLQIGNSVPLLLFVLAYIAFDSLFNFFGINVTKHLSAVHRTMVDTCRGVAVWAWQLLTYYCISERLGERWTKYSGPQIGGFVFLIAGTVIYNGAVRLPGFRYDESDDSSGGEVEGRSSSDKRREKSESEARDSLALSDHNENTSDVELEVANSDTTDSRGKGPLGQSDRRSLMI